MILDNKTKDKIRLILEHKFEYHDLIFDKKKIEIIILNNPIKVTLSLKIENSFILTSTILVNDCLTKDNIEIDTKTIKIEENKIINELYKQIIDVLTKYEIPKY